MREGERMIAGSKLFLSEHYHFMFFLHMKKQAGYCHHGTFVTSKKQL